MTAGEEVTPPPVVNVQAFVPLVVWMASTFELAVPKNTRPFATAGVEVIDEPIAALQIGLPVAES